MKWAGVMLGLGVGLAIVLTGCQLGQASAANTAGTNDIVVTATDYAFSPNTITVTEGTPVKITLANKGAVEHELEIEGLKTNLASVQEPKAMGDMDSHEADAPGDKHEADAHTAAGAPGHEEAAHDKGIVHVHVEKGERDSASFTPLQAGTYEIACNLPGHRELGMVGKIVVLPAPK